jgi:hypothetical protein
MYIVAEIAAAKVCLRDGSPETANAKFEKCFALSLSLSDANMALMCAERLGDLSTGMNGIPTTLRWGGVFLSLALKSKDNRQTMQAFSLFNVALDGFTFMDVHRWRADCMVQMLVD